MIYAHVYVHLYMCIYAYTPVISPTDPPEWEATPQHPGTPAVLPLHMADGWFQNLENNTNMNVTDEMIVVHRSEKKHLLNCLLVPDPFLPLSIKE